MAIILIPIFNCNDDPSAPPHQTLERIQRTGAAAEWIARRTCLLKLFPGASHPAVHFRPAPAPDPPTRSLPPNSTPSSTTPRARISNHRRGLLRPVARRRPVSGCALSHPRRPVRRGRDELRSIAGRPCAHRWHAPAVVCWTTWKRTYIPPTACTNWRSPLVRQIPKPLRQDLIDYRMLFTEASPAGPMTAHRLDPEFPAGALAPRNWRARHTRPGSWPPSKSRSLVTRGARASGCAAK